MPELTPQQSAEQKALNDKVKDLPIISELKDGQDKIIKKIDDEIHHVQEEFEEIREEVSEVKSIMEKGFSDLKSAIKSKENDDLRSELRGLRREKDTENDRRFTLKSGLILVVATVVLTAIFTNLPNISFKAENPKVKYIAK